MSATYSASATAVTYNIQLNGIVPTLYIGLGGTGKEILMRFRRRMYEDYGEPHLPFARTLVFDTDMQKNSDIPKGEEEANYEHVRLSKTKGEWISVEIQPDLYQQAKSDLKTRKDRRYTPWLHKEFFEIVPEKAVQDGAGGYRQAGRLAFFIHYNKIRTAIESELATMLAYMKDPNQQRNPPLSVDNSRIEIVIVSSIAGGTGAGMYLDMAYLVRDIMSVTPKFPKRLAPFDPFGLAYNVTLIATLPTAYGKKDAVMKNRFYMNAYAALLEMEHYNTPRPEENFFEVDEGGVRKVKHRPVQFRVNWEDPGGSERVIDGTPWHTCYIIDDVNDKNRGSERDLSDVHQMVADYLFLDLGANPFSTEKRSVRANHAVLFSNTVTAQVHDPAARQDDAAEHQTDQILYENKYGCSFSSFGLGEIYVDPERIKRCASYQLASTLIRDRWIGRLDKYGPNRYAEWAEEDLYAPELGNDDETLTFSPKVLCRAILREEGHEWIERINGMFDQLEKLDPAQFSGEELERRLSEVLKTIRGSVDGRPAATGERTIEQTLRHRAAKLQGTGPNIGPLRKRLDRRSRIRFSDVGALPVLRLLDDYEQRLHKSREEAAGWAKEGVASIESLIARLLDAIRVPAVLRQTAVRIEYQRACAEARRESMRWCRNAAAKYLDGIYHTSLVFLRQRDNDRQPLQQRYTAWREMLQNGEEQSIASEMIKQFNLFRKQPETDRRIPLVPKNPTTNEIWNTSEYDEETNGALKNHAEVGHDPDSPNHFDWRQLEKLVLRALSATDRCSQVEALYRQHKADPTSLSRLVEEIAAACRGPLGNQYAMHHFADGNIAAYLIQRKDRAHLLKRLTDGSAPYIPSIGAGRRREVVPIWRGVLGATAGETGAAAVARVATDVKEMAGAGSDDPPRDTIDQAPRAFHVSRLIVHREVGGIPAHFYARLTDLRQAYEARENEQHRLTCHVRYRETAEDLPDIVMLSDGEYEQIANQVNDVIRGILLQYITCADDGMFYVQVPQEFMTKTYELGSRINRIVKHACRLPEVRTFLQKRWAKWKDQVAKAQHMAVFYNAIQQNLRLFPSTVPAGQSTSVPPLYNCLRKLLHTTERDLRSAADGERYYKLLKDRDTSDSDYQEWSDRFEAICEHVRQTCLVSACPSFPILQIDEKKIGNVKFFEEAPA